MVIENSGAEIWGNEISLSQKLIYIRDLMFEVGGIPKIYRGKTISLEYK